MQYGDVIGGYHTALREKRVPPRNPDDAGALLEQTRRASDQCWSCSPAL